MVVHGVVTEPHGSKVVKPSGACLRSDRPACPISSIIVVYSIAQIALGVWVARRMKGSSDFFVAGRALGPGLLFATFLAANIGSGSTIGATGLGYRDGLAAMWWVGSAGLGSLVLALSVGPRIRRLAAEHDLRTVGDFLEWRYDRRVRATVAAILWIGTVCILAGQLMGIAWILSVVIGMPKIVGCALGALVVTALLRGRRPEVVRRRQRRAADGEAGRLRDRAADRAARGRRVDGLHAALPDPGMWNPWRNGASGWIYIAMLAPNFIVSPGLLQKVYGARDDRAVRVGVGVNAALPARLRARAGAARDVRARAASGAGERGPRDGAAAAVHARSAVLGGRRSAWPRSFPPR